MSHPLSVTIGESKIIERALHAAGVTCYIHPDIEDAGRVIIKRLSGRVRVGFPWRDVFLADRTYREDYPGYRSTYVLPENGVNALLDVLSWFYKEFFNSRVAAIVVAATRAALDAHTLIADADRREDSIDSGDAIDRCYAAVRVVLPEYTTSADIEPPTPQETE